MFEIGTTTLKGFIDDDTIELPRYQRKQTWRGKQNFKFCLSIFKDYPLGVIVQNVEQDEEGNFQKWLLDGRQRRNVVIEMQNPENIYEWGKDFIGFKARDKEDDVIKKFYETIQLFFDTEEAKGESDQIQTEEDDEGEISSESENQPEDVTTDETEDVGDDNGEENAGSEIPPLTYDDKGKFIRGDINPLLQIILMVHKKRGKKSGLTTPFDYSKFVENLDYLKHDNSIDVNKLLRWIKYRKDIDGKYPDNEQELTEWILKSSRLKDPSFQGRLMAKVSSNWEKIKRIFTLLERLKLQLRETHIGYIQLKNVTETDAQKIFELINKEGTKLEAAEILSAKPSWNEPVGEVSPEIQSNVKELYDRLGVKKGDIVKWDIAATSIKRLKFEYII